MKIWSVKNKNILGPLTRSTVYAVAFSIILASIVFYWTGFYEWGIGIASATLIPLIVTPILSHRIYTLSYELLEAKNKIELLATIDSLTKVANKRHFTELAKRELASGERYLFPVSLMMIDVDHFKTINDRFGHLAGDQALLMTAGVFHRYLRKTDVVGRFGGDEFIILLSHAGLQQADIVATHLRAEIEKLALEAGENKIQITVSMGLVSTESGQKDLEKLIQLADEALYEAKKAGRNRVVSIP